MEATAIRTCERDGCENPVTGKATARFCSPSCRREHNRSKGDGNPDRVYVKGHWKKRPQRRSAARSRPRYGRTAHHSLGITRAGLARQGRPQVHA